MEAAAIGLLDLRNNTTFRNLVNTQVDLQFDEEDEVLLTTIDTLCNANGIDLENEMIESLNNHDRSDLADLVHEAIHGFEYGTDESGAPMTLYPQIYIPFASTVDRSAVPAVGINLAEETGVVNGFDAFGDVTLIDEAFAEATTTWVVGINESVDSRGKWDRFYENKTTAAGDYTILIKKIRLNSKKETFPNGMSELCYAMVRAGSGNCNVGSVKPVYLGKFNQVETSIADPVHFPNKIPQECWIAPKGDPFSPSSTYNEYIYCIWYERDARKKFRRKENIVSGCNSTEFEYRANEPKYGIQPLYNNWITGGNTYGFDNYISNGLSGLDVWQKWN